MFNPKVSVILPIYKAENFIEKCVRSLFEQTLNDMEFVFVNDCTPDNSMEIIDKLICEYPNRMDQILIINHDVNKGVAISRENGNLSASGEFLIHCDSDDWVDINAYKVMYETAKDEDADIVWCNYYTVYSDYSKTFRKHGSFIENKDNLNFNIGPFYGAVWNKLIKRELYLNNNIHVYDDVNVGEDLGLVLRLRFLSQKTIYIDKPLYYHTSFNENSIIVNFTIAKSMQVIKLASNLEDFFINQNYYEKYFLQLQYLKFQSKKHLLMLKKIRNLKKWKTIYPETHQYICSYKQFPLNLRIISWLVANNIDTLAKLLLIIRDRKSI